MMTLTALEVVLPFGIQIAVFALIGLCFGSFATMLLYRLPIDKNIGGRSGCPTCNHQLLWYELIPVVSYVMLRGQCSTCRQNISIRYPLVELLCCALFVVIGLMCRNVPIVLIVPLAIACFFAFLIAFYDAATQHIPDVLTGTLAIAAVLYQMGINTLIGDEIVWESFLGAVMIGIFFTIMWGVSRGRWIGSGDIFLGSALGLLLSLKESLLMLFSAYAIGAVVSFFLLCTKKISRDTQIAFAPFLVLGTFIAFFFGNAILTWYASLLSS